MSGNSLPAGWPEARSLAVAVNVMLEGWTDDSAPGIGPMGNPLKPGILDLQARSWAEYGPKTGAWRLLDLLAAAGVRGLVRQRYRHRALSRPDWRDRPGRASGRGAWLGAEHPAGLSDARGGSRGSPALY
jgi:hypothetical protein